MMIFDRKTINRLSGQMMESNAAKPSSYAMKLMEKMGWKEGQGLGKNESGITKHISIQKREESTGLGHEKAVTNVESFEEQWWNNGFSTSLTSFKSVFANSKSDDESEVSERKEIKEKKRKRRVVESVVEGGVVQSMSSDLPSLDELFLLTGGKMFGMRARREQKGKIRRTESDNRLLSLLKQKNGDDSSGEDTDVAKDREERKAEKKKRSKKEKKQKKEKKEKKTKISSECLLPTEENHVKRRKRKHEDLTRE